jgi:hypothetical protein
MAQKTGEISSNTVQPRPFSRGYRIVVPAIFLLIGTAHWIAFLNLGKISFLVQDWPKELQYYTVLRHAVSEHVIPYSVSEQIQATDRFLAVPETVLSPQIVFLRVMDPGDFVVFNTVLLYVAGLIGCLLIRSKYKLSLLPFTLLFLVFSFNGHITAHLAVGHSMWLGYFLLPFFCLFAIDLVDGSGSANTPLKLALVLFAMVLQGSFHIFVWCLMFLVILGLFDRRSMPSMLSASAWSLLLSSFRIVPAMLTFSGLKQHMFVNGYPTLSILWNALVTVRDLTHQEIPGLFGRLAWWEYDTFIGLIGVVVIAYFGIYLRFSKASHLEPLKYRALDAPIGIMFVLSLSYFYGFLAVLPIPFASTERVASRFLIIPLMMLLILSCIRMEAVLRQIGKTQWVTCVGLLASVQLGFEFLGHSFLWSLYKVEALSPTSVADTVLRVVAPHDRIYVLSVQCSALITAMCILALAVTYWRNRDGESARPALPQRTLTCRAAKS